MAAEDHAKQMEDVISRIKELESKFGSNERIADTLCETAEKATKMQAMLANKFIDLLNTNVPIKEAVQQIMEKSDRNYFILSLRRFGGYVWTIAVIFLTLLFEILIKSQISH